MYISNSYIYYWHKILYKTLLNIPPYPLFNDIYLIMIYNAKLCKL